MTATLQINHAGFRQACEDANLRTNTAIARSLGVDRSTLSRVLGGRNKPGAKFIQGVLRAFGSFDAVFVIREQRA